MTGKINLARSPIAPILGKHLPVRGPARLLYRSFANKRNESPSSLKVLTTKFGDVFCADMSSFLEWQLWSFGSYEGHFAELFSKLIRPGDRCIDVGANIGIHTIRMAKLAGTAGEVLAFEPDEDLVSRANRNLSLNNLANVRLIRSAVTDAGGGTALLYRPAAQDSNKGRASLLPHHYLTGSARTVPTTRIDDANKGPVAVIKIDVEGHEGAVLMGARETISKYGPCIIYEYAPELLDRDANCPFDWLKTNDYESFAVRQTRNILTGRGRLNLEPISKLPETGGNILAVRADTLPTIRQSLALAMH